MLMAAFAKADSDSSGYVGKTEFGHLLRYVVFFFRLWLLFAEMDTGGDGRVTLDEFRRGLVVLELDFHPDPEVNEAYTLQEWHQLDPEGDGLVLFDSFCRFALRWQLVEDFEDQTAAGGGSGKLRERPALDPRFLDGDGAAAEDDDPDSWRTDASGTFDAIRGRTDADITALSLAFYERAVAAGTVAPVGDDDVSELRSRRSWDGGSSSRGQEGRSDPPYSVSESATAEQRAVGCSYSGRDFPSGTSSGTSPVEGGRTYWSREIGQQRAAAAAAATSRQAATTNTTTKLLQHRLAAQPHETVPSYSEACSRNGLNVKIGKIAHMKSSKGLPIVVVRTPYILFSARALPDFTLLALRTHGAWHDDPCAIHFTLSGAPVVTVVGGALCRPCTLCSWSLGRGTGHDSG